MSDRLKYIVSELNKNPFNRNYNLISFDSLSPEDLLQLLTDVLAEINSTNKLDIRTEEPEETTVRLLTMLRVLKYSPGPDPVGFRQGLVQGDKHVIHPILEWLLRHMTELQTRAYLAQFLVKVEIPIEILGDADIAALYDQYEVMIEEFKALHKESVLLKTQGQSTAELRADIEAMEKEHDIVTKRIERLARKLESVENRDEMLEAAKKLRIERERQKELAVQREEELGLIQELQTRGARLAAQLKSIRDSHQPTTPQDVLNRLGEEVRMTEYIVKEKLPKELEAKRKEVEIMSRIAVGAPPTQETLDELNSKIEEVTSEVNELVQKSVARRDSGDETFRQQANIIARKKQEMAESFSQAKHQLDTLLKQKNEGGGEEGRGVSEEEYKEYASKVKVRAAVYRSRRAGLASLVAESGVLARTVDLLGRRLESLEGEAASAHLEDRPPALPKDRLINDLGELNRAIATHKAKMTPALQELKAVKEEYNEVFEEYNEKKRIYDTTAATLESATAKLEQEVKELRKEMQAAESETALLLAKTDIAEALLQRAQDEFSRAASKGSNNTLRERLNNKIAEEERMNRELKEKQKEVKETQEKHARQRDLWLGLKTLLECKEECLEKEKKNVGTMRRDRGAETLVLN